MGAMSGLMYRGLMLGLGSGIHAWLDLEFML